MWTVELKLDETLAEFEVQDWIDNVFSVQFPDIEAKIKTSCQGNCGDKYKAENEQLKAQNEKMKKCAICTHRKSDIEPCDNCKRTNPNASNDYWDLDLSIG